MPCFKPLIALLVLAPFMLKPVHAADDLEVFQCRTEMLQQLLQLNPTPSRMRDVPWLDPTPEFIFQINVKAGRVEKAFYNRANGIREMTEKLAIRSTVRNDDGITKEDGTLSFLLTIERTDEKDTVIDTFTVSVYGRTGRGAFLLSSTKLGPQVRAATSYTGQCTGVPISLFRPH